MKTLDKIRLEKRIIIHETGYDGGWANGYMPGEKKPLMIIFSWGGGWDHVSVSYKNRCCTWDEMCIIKDIFFDEDECVVQYHPKKKDYVNNHPFTLHIWKKQNVDFPIPPKILV